jgi:two-component system response regulator CpxR
MTGLSVLLIEDDRELCELMRSVFARHDMALEAVHDGRRGLSRALGGGHDLILLDVMLPELDGFELLRQVRRRSEVPVIVLSARRAQSDQITGLDAGADDYLPKPFGADELLARIRAVLRRSGRAPATAGEALETEGIWLDPASRRVRVDGEPVELTSIQFEVLEYLMRSAGRIVPRSELSTALFQRAASPKDRSLDVHISHLRKRLGRRGSAIRTVRGVGYVVPPGEAPR